MNATEKMHWSTLTQVAKFVSGSDVPYDRLGDLFDHRTSTLPGLIELTEVKDNVALKEGINALFTLIAVGSANVDLFSAANARVGVGDDDTAANSNQTDLLGAGATYKGMDSGYPMAGTDERVVFQATFEEDEAGTVAVPMDWAEWTVDNGDGANGGDNLNRKAAYIGTKAGGTWVARVTLSMA